MKSMCWFACGVNKPEIGFDSRLAAWDFVDHHPGYTDVIPVDLSDLQEANYAKRTQICVL